MKSIRKIKACNNPGRPHWTFRITKRKLAVFSWKNIITEDSNFDTDDEADLEKNFIINILKNADFCKKFYMDIFNFCAGPFKELISSSPEYIIESIIKDNELNWQVKLNLKLYY